jgi:hypothetical protein
MELPPQLAVLPSSLGLNEPVSPAAFVAAIEKRSA